MPSREHRALRVPVDVTTPETCLLLAHLRHPLLDSESEK